MVCVRKKTSFTKKCVAPTNTNPNKVYLVTAEGDFQKGYYNHKTQFKSKHRGNDIKLSKYIWEMRGKYNDPVLKWSVAKRFTPDSNITKKCVLCLQKKFEIIKYPNPEKLLNKRSELVSHVVIQTSICFEIINLTIEHPIKLLQSVTNVLTVLITFFSHLPDDCVT